MIVTVELSLYPLTQDYEAPIIAFIKHLKSNPEIEVQTHAMSTFVKGENKLVFDAISNAMESIGQTSDGQTSDNRQSGMTFSLVAKIINRDLPVEKGFFEF